MRKTEFDFLTWTSFPSSLKQLNDEVGGWTWSGYFPDTITVRPGSTIKFEFNAKQQNVLTQYRSHYRIIGFDGEKWVNIPRALISLPIGTFDWKHYETHFVVPANIKAIRGAPRGGAGMPEAGITWWDDLKIYMDDKLIYENKFSNWLPYQMAGAVITAIPVGLYATRRMPKITVPQEWWK